MIFKKEKKVELWATDSESVVAMLRSFPILNCKDTPIGIFRINSYDATRFGLETPNEFYDQVIGKERYENIFILRENTENANRQSIVINDKSFQQVRQILNPNIQTQVFVFPNDIRDDQYFEPCYGCPHRMAELYSSLELHLMQFENSTL
ncbi:MAG: hypothetical protein AAF573_19650 [Bacteroidota bacterium]